MKKFLKKPILKLIWTAGSIIGGFFDRPFDQTQISKILIFQGGGIGDVIRLFPSVLSLRETFPEASIITLTQFGERIFRLFPAPENITEHLIYDLKKAHKGFLQKLSLIQSLRKRNFDLVFSPNYGLGMIEATLISFLIGARYRIGFDSDGSGFLYTTKCPLTTDRPILEQNLMLLSQAGILHKSHGPYLAIPEEDLAYARSLFSQYGISEQDRIITLAPGVKEEADYKSFPEYRAWPYERYTLLIKEISHKLKAKILLLGNIPKDRDKANTRRAAEPFQNNVIELFGATSIAQAAALISLSDIFIGNDSGPLHIAVALQKPCIGIFGATSPAQVIPAANHALTIYKNLPCSPCFSHQPLFQLKCPYQIECLRSITVEEVFRAAGQLLQNVSKSPGNTYS